MSDRPVRVGFVGFGRQAEFHASAMAATPQRFALAAVCDVTPSRQEAARAQFDMPADSDLDAFLRRDLELVFITTNSSSHHDIALTVAAAGKHMVVEKPLAMTSREAAEMLEAARRHGVLLTCYHNRRWDPDVLRVRRVVQEGRLGDLFLVENRSASSRPAHGFGVPEFNQAWRITKALGGGTIFDFGPHWFDQVLSVVPGRVVQVYADVRHLAWGDADDHFDVKLVFEHGCRATVSKTDVAYLAWPKWMVFGMGGTLRHDDSCRVRLESGEEYVQEDGDPAVDLHQNYYEAVRRGKPLAVTGDEAKRNIDLIEASLRSADAGRSLDVSI